MKIPDQFEFKRILVDGKKSNSVSEIFSSFSEIPKDRKMNELFEAVAFSKCLEIWSKNELTIYYVDEEKSQYKGVDFFVIYNSNQKGLQAFQLIEFKTKFTSVENTEEFVSWIKEKKFKKGDKKANLLINFSVVKNLSMDVALLRNLLKDSPFLNIVLFGLVEKNEETKIYIIIFLSGFNAYAIVNLQEETISESSGDCPFFAATNKEVIKRSVKPLEPSAAMSRDEIKRKDNEN
jgi:hypothetical protein